MAIAVPKRRTDTRRPRKTEGGGGGRGSRRVVSDGLVTLDNLVWKDWRQHSGVVSVGAVDMVRYVCVREGIEDEGRAAGFKWGFIRAGSGADDEKEDIASIGAL